MISEEQYDDMTITLCESRTERLCVSVRAYFKDGKLTVEGQDLGTVTEEWFGSDEFEYYFYFDECNTRKLLQILAENRKNPIDEFRRRFSGLNGFNDLRTFCEKNEILRTYFSWHSS